MWRGPGCVLSGAQMQIEKRETSGELSHAARCGPATPTAEEWTHPAPCGVCMLVDGPHTNRLSENGCSDGPPSGLSPAAVLPSQREASDGVLRTTSTAHQAEVSQHEALMPAAALKVQLRC
ncbi:hypothetical protein NDU88_005601 [Pleurodeles waltl]|uniref:Uncharacterized protein n=1 Tax=Pleurodeles waltl TaxID=8319 RepID=A0AAV7LLK9_PLEWA|nr:hypothetical protein NDU88_005601 [Pleurodeles waltl]